MAPLRCRCDCCDCCDGGGACFSGGRPSRLRSSARATRASVAAMVFAAVCRFPTVPAAARSSRCCGVGALAAAARVRRRRRSMACFTNCTVGVQQHVLIAVVVDYLVRQLAAVLRRRHPPHDHAREYAGSRPRPPR